MFSCFLSLFSRYTSKLTTPHMLQTNKAPLVKQTQQVVPEGTTGDTQITHVTRARAPVCVDQHLACLPQRPALFPRTRTRRSSSRRCRHWRSPAPPPTRPASPPPRPPATRPHCTATRRRPAVLPRDWAGPGGGVNRGGGGRTCVFHFFSLNFGTIFFFVFFFAFGVFCVVFF